MKFPNHIILDFNKKNLINNTQYWALNYIIKFQKYPLFFENFYFFNNDKSSNILTNKLIFNKNKKIDKNKIKNLIKINIIKINKNKINLFKNNYLWNLFNINFLRKEKIYTKLKYSRVPQYDIVSGGLAALLCGFLGFLICEKFGLELLDSGDFYLFFMYLVFIAFFLRLFLKILNNNEHFWFIINLKFFFIFYVNIFIIFFNFLKSNIFK